MIGFAPHGRMLVSGDRVCCHLCGRWFRSVASHLRAHGWTISEYVDAFGLELANPLCGPTTTKRRAAAMTGRMASEPAIRAAQAAARERSRSGRLAELAAAANRGRPHPAQRRRKTMTALARISPDRQAAANRSRAERSVRESAQCRATERGYGSFAAYAAARRSAGLSLAAISRECGQHRNWLARHRELLLPVYEPVPDAAWGVDDVAGFLRQRHLVERRSVTAIAVETGRPRAAVLAALHRHGIPVTAHAASRGAARARDGDVAAAMGFASLAAYVGARRARGASWAGIAAECGLPASTLRRRAG